MVSYPVDIRRCRHVKTNGTQCGSPALKDKELCYYHERNRPAAASIYIDGERYPDQQIMIPPFEDAHSIQMVIRHVVELMLSRRIERKDAGVMLYALQIASSNLKRMQAERARPTQVVVDPEKAGETPLGMTPWSASGQGHDPEEEATPLTEAALEEFYGGLSEAEKETMEKKYEEAKLMRNYVGEDYKKRGGADPILAALGVVCRERVGAGGAGLG